VKRFLLLSVMAVTASFFLAAVPKAPSTFEIRLVVPEAGPDTEGKVFVNRPGEPGETLHLRKVPLIDRSALADAEVLKYPVGDAQRRGEETLSRSTPGRMTREREHGDV
jgi:hypothetical protein